MGFRSFFTIWSDNFYDFRHIFIGNTELQVFNDQHGYKLNILSAGERES